MNASTTARSLPVLATAMSVYRVTFNNWGYALRIAWPWLVILTLLSVPLIMLLDPSDAADIPESFTQQIIILFILRVLASMAGWSSIAVLWHRRLLRGEALGGTPIEFSKRSLNYLLRFIFIAIIVAIPIVVTRALSGDLIQVEIDKILTQIVDIDAGSSFIVLGSVAAAAAFGIFSLRLSIALPAAALEHHGFVPSKAWDATAGNGIRLLMITLLTAAPVFLIISLYDASTVATGPFESIAGALVYALLWELFNFVWVMLAITLLSVAYALLVENRELDIADEPAIP